MSAPEWVSCYVGLPYVDRGRGPHGWDCWGLVQLVSFDRFGVKVPSYVDDYQGANHAVSVSDLIAREARRWNLVDGSQARAGDVVVLNIAGRSRHCGILVAPPLMLHTLAGTESCLERIDSPRWNRRVAGIYRHRDDAWT